jgi:alpha-tubulin suppressor-like RCC1 family protein
VGAFHSAALTGDGKLYTWWHDNLACLKEQDASGAGYPLPDLGDVKTAFCRPKCVEALAGMRIVSVAAGNRCTIVVTDKGGCIHSGWVCSLGPGQPATPGAPMSAIQPTHRPH